MEFDLIERQSKRTETHKVDNAHDAKQLLFRLLKDDFDISEGAKEGTIKKLRNYIEEQKK